MRTLSLAFTVLAASLSTAATAVTVDLSKSITATAGSPSFYIVDNDFTLPVSFSNAVLTISNLEIDDRGIVLLNGLAVDNAGIFGPGAGSLVLTLGGPNNPFTYTRGNGARNIVLNSNFVSGSNTFRIVVNDTNAGIGGDVLPNGVNISGASITASLTYDIAAVPEPASWAMMIAGFGLAGAAVRRRQPVRAAIA